MSDFIGNVARWTVGLIAVGAIVSATAASAIVWLLVTDPVATADAIAAALEGDIGPFVRAVSSILYEALCWLLALQ
jgi:hypothetical protein